MTQVWDRGDAYLLWRWQEFSRFWIDQRHALALKWGNKALDFLFVYFVRFCYSSSLITRQFKNLRNKVNVLALPSGTMVGCMCAS